MVGADAGVVGGRSEDVKEAAGFFVPEFALKGIAGGVGLRGELDPPGAVGKCSGPCPRYLERVVPECIDLNWLADAGG